MNKANFGAWDTGEHHMVVESEDEELPKVSHLVSSWTQKSQTLGILELDRTSVTIQLSALSYEELTHRHPPQMASSGQVILGFLDTQTQMVVPCGVVTSSPPCGPPTTVQPWTNLISLLLPRQQNFMILGSFLMLYSLPPKSDNPTFISSKKKKKIHHFLGNFQMFLFSPYNLVDNNSWKPLSACWCQFFSLCVLRGTLFYVFNNKGFAWLQRPLKVEHL